MTPPPWALEDGGWEEIQTRRDDLWSVFQDAAVELEPPSDGGGASGGNGLGPETLVLLEEAAINVAYDLGDLMDQPMSDDLAKRLFLRAQGDADPRAAERDGPPRVDFEEFMTWLWMMAKARYGPIADSGFGTRVSEWLRVLSQVLRGGAVPIPTVGAAEAATKKKKAK